MTRETEQKLVPVEPTEAMIKAGYDPWLNKGSRKGRSVVRGVYLSMLAAAPPAPSGWRSMESAPVGGPENADRTHVPDLERKAFNPMPNGGDWRDLKLFRYDGTDLYQWFGKRGQSVFEDAGCDPFVMRSAAPDHIGDVTEMVPADVVSRFINGLNPSGGEVRVSVPALQLATERLIAALSAPVSGGEGEAVAWRYRDHPENGWVYTGVGGRHDGCEVQPLYTHPSDPAATERMRAALEPFAEVARHYLTGGLHQDLQSRVPSLIDMMRAEHFYAARAALGEA